MFINMVSNYELWNMYQEGMHATTYEYWLYKSNAVWIAIVFWVLFMDKILGRVLYRGDSIEISLD